MAYVRTYGPWLNLSAPDTVAGFRQRYEAQTKEISETTQARRRIVLKIIRSVTFMHAKDYLGEVRFHQLLREVGLSRRSPRLRWHRLVAENAYKLLLRTEWLPDDDAVLLRLATLTEQELREWRSSKKPSPR